MHTRTHTHTDKSRIIESTIMTLTNIKKNIDERKSECVAILKTWFYYSTYVGFTNQNADWTQTIYERTLVFSFLYKSAHTIFYYEQFQFGINWHSSNIERRHEMQFRSELFWLPGKSLRRILEAIYLFRKAFSQHCRWPTIERECWGREIGKSPF